MTQKGLDTTFIRILNMVYCEKKIKSIKKQRRSYLSLSLVKLKLKTLQNKHNWDLTIQLRIIQQILLCIFALFVRYLKHNKGYKTKVDSNNNNNAWNWFDVIL